MHILLCNSGKSITFAPKNQTANETDESIVYDIGSYALAG